MATERTERSARGASDRELVRRFARSEDEAAFEEMVRRHGALVLGVCRRVLGDGHDVEDAFQATFLVLASRARSIRRKASLASWLHGVAYRIALKEAKQRYAAREEPLGEVVANEEDPFDRLARRQDERALDEELRALGEKYRRPLVLHYLEGRTNQDIAAELGLSVSAVEGRLKRAKAQLRRRLLRRGITLATLGAVACASQEAARADVSASLIASTVESSVPYAAGNPCGTGVSHQLAQSEVLAMASTARNLVALAALSAAVACVGVWSAVTFGAGQKAGGAGAGQKAGAALTATAEAPPENQPAAQPAAFAAVTIETEPAQGASGAVHGSGGEFYGDFYGGYEAHMAGAPEISAGGTAPASKEGSPRYYYTYSGPSTSSTSRQRKAVEQIQAALDKELETAPLQASQPLEQFVVALRKELGVPVVVDRRALEDVGITPDEPMEVDLPDKGLSARSFLRLALDQYDLDYVIADEVLLISTPEELENRLETIVYSTRELQISGEELSETIMRCVDPPTWEEVGGPGTLVALPPPNESLVISQTQRVHEQIADLLEQMRRNAIGNDTFTRGRASGMGMGGFGTRTAAGRAETTEKRPGASPPAAAPGAAAPGVPAPAPAVQSSRPTRIGPPAPEATLRVSFRYQPWKDVLEWLASTQSLSLVMDVEPPGVFNYTDPEPKTAQEVIELLNSVLLPQGYALVTQGKTLRVVQIQMPKGGSTESAGTVSPRFQPGQPPRDSSGGED